MTGGGAVTVCLDLTRTARRGGLGPGTGIDRVERAWASHVAATGGLGLVRTRLGWCLIGQEGVGVAATDPCRFAREFRVFSLARAPRPALTWLLRRYLPERSAVLNAGHSGLHREQLARARAGAGLLAVILHDVIPLEHPHWAAPGMDRSVARRMAAVAAEADVVFVPAEATLRSVARALGPDAAAPVVSAFGVGPFGGTASPPPTKRGPYFCAIGTIEPRKNIGLLLDTWEVLAGRLWPELPALVIAGRRGWAGEQLFGRLDAGIPGVEVRSGLSDAEVEATIRGALGLLFPSRAEGFGFPPLEAAALGTPVIAAGLPQTRELLGDWPVYASPDDRYQWADAVSAMMTGDKGAKPPMPALPTWDRHFDEVRAALGWG